MVPVKRKGGKTNVGLAVLAMQNAYSSVQMVITAGLEREAGRREVEGMREGESKDEPERRMISPAGLVLLCFACV